MKYTTTLNNNTERYYPECQINLKVTTLNIMMIVIIEFSLQLRLISYLLSISVEEEDEEVGDEELEEEAELEDEEDEDEYNIEYVEVSYISLMSEQTLTSESDWYLTSPTHNLYYRTLKKAMTKRTKSRRQPRKSMRRSQVIALPSS
jgi:hypothetical protein